MTLTMRIFAALFSILLILLLGQRSFAEECQYDFQTKRFYGDCILSPGASQAGEGMPCDRALARISIDWVFADHGAKGTYAGFIRQGYSPLDAVIGAQGHNPEAQAAIRACSSFAASYMSSAFGIETAAAPAASPASIGNGMNSCSAPPFGACGGCEIVCPSGKNAYCESGEPKASGDGCFRNADCRCLFQ